MLSPIARRLAAGRTDLAFELLDAGHTADGHDPDGVAWLAWCAYYGDVSAIRWLCSRGANLAMLGPNFDLNGAAFHGHWRLCEFLIEQGADPNGSLPDTGETALHAATAKADRSEYHPVIQVLLRAGADPERRTRAGVETGSFMRDCRTRGETPLHRAAAFAPLTTIELLLDAGASRETRDAHGDSPLGWASWYRREPAILRALCFGEHRVHAQSRPLHESLLGQPDTAEPDRTTDDPPARRSPPSES